MNYLYIIVLLSVFFVGCDRDSENLKTSPKVINVTHVKALLHAPELPARHSPEELVIKNISLPGRVGRSGLKGAKRDIFNGKYMRALRFQNITEAVEKRYGIPDGILLAMMVQETHGVQLLPNGANDGGFGLIHMQPLLARKYNLKTYKNSSKKIDHEQGRELRSRLVQNKFQLEKVYHLDERLDMLKNIDAAGRMIATYYFAGTIDSKNRKFNRFDSAIWRYAGSTNGAKYEKGVKENMSMIHDKDFMMRLGKLFNKMNPKAEINGKSVNFDGYIQAFHDQNMDWGLSEYLDLPRLQINKTEQSAHY